MIERYKCIRSENAFRSPEHSHRTALFNAEVLNLGRLQWFLENGDTTIHREFWESEDSKVRTQFGNELNGDAIYWWVAKAGIDRNELRGRTEVALEAAELFKVATKDLKYNAAEFSYYDEFLARLQEAAIELHPQIALIETYAQWLHSHDPKGPGILFSYRVWGSTRRSERHAELVSESVDEEPPETIESLSLAVLGLWSNRLYTFDRELFYKGDAFYSSHEGETQRFSVSESRLMRPVARYALDQFAEYAIFLRDSLRNILLEIEKYEAQEQKILSDEFLRRFVDAARNSPKQETLHWDFKKTLQMWHAQGSSREQAKVKLCEHIAGFANAKGGVLMIGVTDDRQLKGLPAGKDLENKLASLGEAIIQLIDYPRSIATPVELIMKSDEGKVSCVVVVVPECSDVVGVKKDNGYTYPVRTTSGKTYRSPSEIQASKRTVKRDNFDQLASVASQLVEEYEGEVRE